MVDEGKEGRPCCQMRKMSSMNLFHRRARSICVDVELLESRHVVDSIVGSGSGIHGGTTYLEEVLATEGEIVAFEHELQEFDEGGIDGMLGPRSDGFQSFESCLDTLGVGHVSVEAADV